MTSPILNRKTNDNNTANLFNKAGINEVGSFVYFGDCDWIWNKKICLNGRGRTQLWSLYLVIIKKLFTAKVNPTDVMVSSKLKEQPKNNPPQNEFGPMPARTHPVLRMAGCSFTGVREAVRSPSPSPSVGSVVGLPLWICAVPELAILQQAPALVYVVCRRRMYRQESFLLCDFELCSWEKDNFFFSPVNFEVTRIEWCGWCLKCQAQVRA